MYTALVDPAWESVNEALDHVDVTGPDRMHILVEFLCTRFAHYQVRRLTEVFGVFFEKTRRGSSEFRPYTKRHRKSLGKLRKIGVALPPPSGRLPLPPPSGSPQSTTIAADPHRVPERA